MLCIMESGTRGDIWRSRSEIILDEVGLGIDEFSLVLMIIADYSSLKLRSRLD